MAETRSPRPRTDASAHYLITGFPGFLGRRLVQQIARAEPSARMHLVVQPKFLHQAQRQLETLGVSEVAEVLTGDVADMHLGLSGHEYQTLCDQVNEVFHLAAISYLGVPKPHAYRVNVEGTRNVLELAREAGHLRRFNHLSTCYVSGDRVGVIAEDELDLGQGFRNAYEETKFEAEKLVQRAAASLPVSIFRPSSVVGDSQTGEIDRFDGPYYLALLLVMSPLVTPLPLPGDGAAPLNVVPADFVVNALWALSRDPRALGQTYHLVDPHPMSVRRAYQSIAEKAHRKPPKVQLSTRAAEVVLKLPLLEKWVRPQRAAVGYANQLAFYDCKSALGLLEGTSIRCPPLSDYMDRLMEYVKAYYRREGTEVAEPEDAFDVAATSGG